MITGFPSALAVVFLVPIKVFEKENQTKTKTGL